MTAEKILLKNYECPLGKADKITKKNGKLLFYGTTEKVVEYYLKRYGIKDVAWETKKE